MRELLEELQKIVFPGRQQGLNHWFILQANQWFYLGPLEFDSLRPLWWWPHKAQWVDTGSTLLSNFAQIFIKLSPIAEIQALLKSNMPYTLLLKSVRSSSRGKDFWRQPPGLPNRILWCASFCVTDRVENFDISWFRNESSLHMEETFKYRSICSFSLFYAIFPIIKPNTLIKHLEN